MKLKCYYLNCLEYGYPNLVAYTDIYGGTKEYHICPKHLRELEYSKSSANRWDILEREKLNAK